MLNGLYIVIVNWNLKEDTLTCINSLVQAGVELDQIIVVDNSSTDGSVNALREKISSTLPIIESNTNLGFAGGNNLGIQFAINQGAEWILLLNNDTIVATDIITQLGVAIQDNPEFSIIAPIIYYSDHPEVIWYLGDHLIPGTLITTNSYRGNKDTKHLPAILPVDFVSGCGMMVKKEVFEKVGLFDASMFMYAEEVDFCWRARQSGYRLACVTRAKMWHHVSTSANKDQETSRYLRIRNQVRFYRRYARGLQIPIMFFFSLVRSIFLVIQDILRRQTHLVMPSMQGWLHGWFKPDNLKTN
jgi:GT2 family glycosyltransferase